MFGAEKKVTKDKYQQRSLLQMIAERWRKVGMIPVFVSEGITKHKLQTILRSRYLEIVYREALLQSG